MRLLAFSLLDTKTGAFGVPFFVAHVGQVVRACMDLGRDMDTTVGRHPSDFALCQIGFFDDAGGVLEATPLEQLGVIAQFLPQQPALSKEFEEHVRRMRAADPQPKAPGEHTGNEEGR